MLNPFNPDTIKVDHLPEVVWAKALSAQRLYFSEVYSRLTVQGTNRERFHIEQFSDGNLKCLHRGYNEKAEDQDTPLMKASANLKREKFSLIPLGGSLTCAGLAQACYKMGVSHFQGNYTEQEIAKHQENIKNDCLDTLQQGVARQVSKQKEALFNGLPLSFVSGNDLSASYRTCVEQAPPLAPQVDVIAFAAGTTALATAFLVAGSSILTIKSRRQAVRAAKIDEAINQGNRDLVKEEMARRNLQTSDYAPMA